MSLDKTLENVNLSLISLTSGIDDLLAVFRLGAILIVTALCIMIIGLTILCYYVKCNEIRSIIKTNKTIGLLDNNDKAHLSV
ncbi:Cytochrome c biogenesis protein CcsB [Dirofilaria immitis]